MSQFSHIYSTTASQMLFMYHGEDVKYHRTGEHKSRDYRAVVIRELSLVIREVGDIIGNGMIISLHSSSNKDVGIQPSEVNTDSDQIAVSLRPGEPPVLKQVVKLLDCSAGLTRVLVQ